jgi:hypothetical protein
MLRSLVNYGREVLGDEDCDRLSVVLHRMKFKKAQSQAQSMTADHAQKIIAEANRQGFPSIALAQAIQFDCGLRQKDVIGEWVPLSDPTPSSIVMGDLKWVRGITWDRIDHDDVLHHVTSMEGTPIRVEMRKSKMVMDQLWKMKRGTEGPVIVAEDSKLPWRAQNFRLLWRKIARDAGVPDQVKNRDSRSGGFSASDEPEPPEPPKRKVRWL